MFTPCLIYNNFMPFSGVVAVRISAIGVCETASAKGFLIMYTTIIHPIRKSLLLSCNEYCVLDMVYQLSNNREHNGWCWASKQYIAESLDLSKQSILNILNALELKGLIIRNPATKFLRASDEYCEMIANKNDYLIAKKGDHKFVSGRFTNGKESLPEQSKNLTGAVKKVYRSGKESLPNNNNYNNNYNNSDKSELKNSVQLFNEIKSDFLAWYKYIKKVDYYFTGKDGSAIKQIIKKIEFQNSGASPRDDFRFLLKNINDQWINENLSLSLINSKFNEILSKIKNGTTTKQRESKEDTKRILEQFFANMRDQSSGGSA